MRNAAPWFVRWGSMFVAALTLAACALWAAPDSSARAHLDSTMARVADVARSTLDRLEWKRLWKRLGGELRAVGVPGLGDSSEEARAAVDVAPAAPSPTPDELAAAAARLADASKHLASSAAIADAPQPQPDRATP